MPTIEELEVELKSLTSKNKALENKLEKAEKIEEDFKILNKKIGEYEIKIKENLEKENSFQKNQIFKNSNIDDKHLEMVSKLTVGIEASALENELKKDSYDIFKKSNMFHVDIVSESQTPETKQDTYMPLDNKLQNYFKKFN